MHLRRHYLTGIFTCVLFLVIGCTEHRSVQRFEPDVLQHMPSKEFDNVQHTALANANKMLVNGQISLSKDLFRVLMERSHDESVCCAAVRGFGRVASSQSTYDMNTIMRFANDSRPRIQDALIDSLIDMAEWDIHNLRQYVLCRITSKGFLLYESTPSTSTILLRAMARLDIEETKKYLDEYISRAEPEIRMTVLELLIENPPIPPSYEAYLSAICGAPQNANRSVQERAKAMTAYLMLAKTTAGGGDKQRACSMYENALRFKVNRSSQLRAAKELGQTRADARTIHFIREFEPANARKETQQTIINIACRMKDRGLLDNKVIEELKSITKEAVSPEIRRAAENAITNMDNLN